MRKPKESNRNLMLREEEEEEEEEKGDESKEEAKDFQIIDLKNIYLFHNGIIDEDGNFINDDQALNE